MVLHENIAVAKLGKAAAPRSASSPGPWCSTLRLGAPAPGCSAYSPGRVEAAGGLPTLLLRTISHRFPSQPEDKAGQGITNLCPYSPICPLPQGHAAPGRKAFPQATQLTRLTHLLPPAPAPLPACPGPGPHPGSPHPGKGSRLQSMV